MEQETNNEQKTGMLEVVNVSVSREKFESYMKCPTDHFASPCDIEKHEDLSNQE
jgi:hypothetical protein